MHSIATQREQGHDFGFVFQVFGPSLFDHSRICISIG
jgi:hypothetical protein